MLSIMRENASSWLVKILLGMIVLVFVFLGMGSLNSDKNNIVATVNDEPITIDEYKQEYNNIVQRLRNQFGSQLNDELLKMFQVRKQALNTLIDKKVVLEEARKLGIKVSDQELGASIANIKVFQKNGIFDGRLYRTILTRNRMNPEMFELLQRNSLLQGKLSDIVMGSAKVSQAQAEEWFAWENSSVSIKYALFSSDLYSNLTPSKEEVKTFYEKNKNSYKTEPELQVKFLRFNPIHFKDSVEITETMVSEYFNEKSDQFRKPATVEARHILLKVAPSKEVDKDSDDKIKKHALEIAEKAKKGEDFAELAKKYSEGPSKDKGGYLGTFEKKDMVKPFADKAFAMKAGEVSEPVKTQFGWHIIKVEKVNKAMEPSLADAEKEIRKSLMDEKAIEIAWEEAEATYDLIINGDTLEKVAHGKITVKTTALFSKTGAVKDVNNSSEFIKVSFALPDMEISELQDIDGEYYIMQVIKKVPAKVSPLKDVYAKVENDLLKQMKNNKAASEAKKVLLALKAGKTLEDICKPLKVSVESTKPFKRSGTIEKIGSDRLLMEAAFKLSATNKISPEVINGQKGYYVIVFIEKLLPNKDEFTKQQKQIKKTLLTRKKSELFQGWLEQEKKGYEITVEDNFL